VGVFLILGNWLSTCRRLKLDPYLCPCTKINSKWIKDFNVRPETLKLPQGKNRENFGDIGLGNYFLNRIPIAQEIRTRIGKWECTKLKSFCAASFIIASG
jgi:hypothetical protein